MCAVVYTKKAAKDIVDLKVVKLDGKVKVLIDLIKADPFKNPPPFEKLQGNFRGAYSRRINIKHRLVYEVIKERKCIKMLSMWRIMRFKEILYFTNAEYF